MCGTHLSASSESTEGACASVYGVEEEEFDWTIEQKLPEEDQTTDKTSLNNTAVHYGFANQHCGVLAKLQVLFL